ncbi:hypothetical protein LCGC14_1162540 [marine sediment metagenome]|uniref:Uncharacterized protein n=1 Tax=marine sediment metagenome TaxID=412755 RepID=A0A0F9PAI0_9ZZZZ
MPEDTGGFRTIEALEQARANTHYKATLKAGDADLIEVATKRKKDARTAFLKERLRAYEGRNAPSLTKRFQTELNEMR